jgi:hypothetical protein
MDELTRNIRRVVAMQAVMLFGDDWDKAAVAELRARLDVIAERMLGS